MLNLKIYKYNSFLDYINYILNEYIKINEEKDFIKFLKKNLIQDFNLNKNFLLKKDIIEGNEEEKKEMKNLNDTIINKFAYNKSFSSIQDFKLYKKIFDENNDKIKLNDPNKEKLEKLIISKMEKILIDYLDIDDYYALKRKIADAIENKEAEKTFGKINEILEKFKKEPKKLKNEMEFLNKINEYRISITNIDKESPFLQEIEKKSKELNNSLNNTSGIRFLAVGKYSTGKSSFLNSLIGNNINLLQTSISECTNFGLLIKYIKKKEDICLIEAEKQISINKVFIKEKEKGNINKEENQIKNIIKELNNNKTKELKYYILKIPIKFLDEYNDEKINQIKDKIEFLDFPGLYTSSNNKENNLIDAQDLLKCIDGFLFLYKEKYFDNDLIK